MTENFLTEMQAERAKRNEKICSEFNSLRAKHPDVKAERLFVSIGRKYDMTSGSIRGICKQAGLC